MIETADLISNQLCYPAERSEMQPLGETNERGGEGTICGGPTLSGGLSPVQTTCWKPRGGAQPDSLGSARLPGAAAPALSQGLSCSRNTTRNCNPSQSQHPEMLPLAAPFTIRTPPAQAQAQHRRPHCSCMQDCALRCIINLMLKLHFHFQEVCLEQYDKHRQGNYLQNLWELCLC